MRWMANERKCIVSFRDDDGVRQRRYLCRCCKRTVSLLPEFVLPWLRFSISVIALFLVTRLLKGFTLGAAARAARATWERGDSTQFPCADEICE